MNNKNIPYIDEHGEVVHKVRKVHKIYKAGDWSRIADYSGLGFYLVAPLILGIAIGILLDNWFHTKPIFTIGLIILGTAGSFYNLYKIFIKEDASHKH